MTNIDTNLFGSFGQESSFSKEDCIEDIKWYQEHRRKVLNLPKPFKRKLKKKSGNSK